MIRAVAGVVVEAQKSGILKVAALYIVAAWAAFQAADSVLPRLGLHDRAVQAVLALAIAMFPIALVIAGLRAVKRGAFPSNRSKLVVAALVTLTGCMTLAGWVWQQAPPLRNEDGRPLVLMMDSPHPRRVYDPETLAQHGTNADVVSDILLDLPIRRQKETIGPYWHRDEEMRQFDPTLILVHWSGFCADECDAARVRLRQFIEYFADSNTQFLIYSRQPADSLPVRVERMLRGIPDISSSIRERVHTFALDSASGIPHYWRSPVTANELKLRVRRILGVQ